MFSELGINPVLKKCFDKFDSAVDFLLQKNNIRNISNMYDPDSYFSLFVSCYVYKGENSIHASPHSGFHSLEHDALDERICKKMFWRKYDNHRTGNEYLMKDEKNHTETQANIFQKSSIIVKRFSVL